MQERRAFGDNLRHLSKNYNAADLIRDADDPGVWERPVSKALFHHTLFRKRPYINRGALPNGGGCTPTFALLGRGHEFAPNNRRGTSTEARVVFEFVVLIEFFFGWLVLFGFEFWIRIGIGGCCIRYFFVGEREIRRSKVSYYYYYIILKYLFFFVITYWIFEYFKFSRSYFVILIFEFTHRCRYKFW